MGARATDEDKVRALAHCVKLMQELESTLKGWVLQADAERVEKLFDPFHDLLDELDPRP